MTKTHSTVGFCLFIHFLHAWLPFQQLLGTTEFLLAKPELQLLVLGAWGCEEEGDHISGWQHGPVMYPSSTGSHVLDQEIIGTSKLMKGAICRLHLEVFLRLDMHRAVAVIN